MFTLSAVFIIPHIHHSMPSVGGDAVVTSRFWNGVELVFMSVLRFVWLHNVCTMKGRNNDFNHWSVLKLNMP